MRFLAAGAIALIMMSPAAAQEHRITEEQCDAIRAAMANLAETVVLALRHELDMSKFKIGIADPGRMDFVNSLPQSGVQKHWNADLVSAGSRALRAACQL